jgi:heme/copper-type cytochrome/quinol oxidase subunit 1
VVAHFHYVLSMGAVFGLFTGFFYWLPKMTGYYNNIDILGNITFWVIFTGVNTTFMPQHFLGLAGMPRRIPDYPIIYSTWNQLSSLGSSITLIGILWLVYYLFSFFSEKYCIVWFNNLYIYYYSTFLTYILNNYYNKIGGKFFIYFFWNIRDKKNLFLSFKGLYNLINI